MNTLLVDDSEVQALLASEESHFVDVKSARISPAKLSRSVSSFANAAGGEILIGIEEEHTLFANRGWDGFEDLEQANPIFQVLDKMVGLSDQYYAEFLENEKQKGYLLRLTIHKTKSIVVATNGQIYKRNNAQNLPVDEPDKLARLELDKGIVSHEDMAVHIPKEALIESEILSMFAKNVVPKAVPEKWLKSQYLLENDKPIVAGVLLYTDVPQAALPKRSAIKLFRYKTSDAVGRRENLDGQPLTIEGPVYSMIYEAVETTKDMVEEIKKLGSSGLESVTYPDETLHEVVTNAVLHRDYSIIADIQIRIFDNRIEVESPGVLPGHITLENILDEQSARNPKIVRLINKFPDPPNKDVGEGLNTAFAAMNNLSLKPPQILENENSVLVRIAHTPLASPEDTVMEYLQTHDRIKNSTARKLTGIQSENTMKNVFKRLQSRDLIQMVPGLKGAASAWEKVNK